MPQTDARRGSVRLRPALNKLHKRFHLSGDFGCAPVRLRTALGDKDVQVCFLRVVYVSSASHGANEPARAAPAVRRPRGGDDWRAQRLSFFPLFSLWPPFRLLLLHPPQRTQMCMSSCAGSRQRKRPSESGSQGVHHVKILSQGVRDIVWGERGEGGEVGQGDPRRGAPFVPRSQERMHIFVRKLADHSIHWSSRQK